MTCTLAPERQYGVWLAGQRDGKVAKLPADWRTGAVVSAHDPATWTDAATARAAAARLGPAFGLSFVLTEADPYWFLDIDHCLMDGAWSPLAAEMCTALPGCYVEVSQSGQGLHILGRGAVPPHRIQDDAIGLALYTRLRFCALTFNQARGDMTLDATAAISGVAAKYLPPTAQAAEPTAWTDAPCEGWAGYADDDSLIDHARASASAAAAFSGRPSFGHLWDADEAVLGRAYPDASGDRAYDASAADAALAQHLAFWTGKDAERIKRLMCRSALNRDKYERDDYLYRTVLRACSLQREVHTGRRETRPAPASDPERTPASTVLASDLDAWFTGLVYVENRFVAAAPDGTLLKPEQFRTTFRYGGRKFMTQSEGKSTDDAWKAFIANELWKPPSAHALCFRPELPPRTLIEDGGLILFNSYVPIKVPSKPGDPSLFLKHMTKLFPNKQDRDWLLAWMARCVQSPGVKLLWAPLIQGTPGNGKSILLEIMVRAIGERYCHLPKADDMDNKFNGWVDGKLFVGVEEIYTQERHNILNNLLVLVTQPRVEIQRKGVDQVMGDNRANLMFLTNHKNAIPKTADDRRYAVYLTPQQCAEDLIRDGMEGDYFMILTNWLKHEDGYAVCAHFLQTMPIAAELDPAGAVFRAPRTSSTDEAIAASLGVVEQTILEAVEGEDIGFRGGWISSHWLGLLLEQKRLAHRCPPNIRDQVMRTLGYVPHPALPRGRVNNPVAPEQRKPRLWIRAGHISTQLTTAAGAADAYAKANRVDGITQVG